MFLAVLGMPNVPDADARAAAAAGIARADAKQRLAGTLPRVLFSAERDEVEAARDRLEQAGFTALAFDPLGAPTDDDRLVARKLALGASLGVFTGAGEQHDVPWDAIVLVQRGIRTATSQTETTTKERTLSVGKTLLAGGIPIMKTVAKKATVRSESSEPFVVFHRDDGGEDVILYEQRLDYSFLGGRIEPVARANLQRAVTEILARATRAVVDDRLQKPGFVAGLPRCAADPADVALHLVRLARLVQPS